MTVLNRDRHLLELFQSVRSVIDYVVADIRRQDPEGMLLLLVDELLKLDETVLAAPSVGGWPAQSPSTTRSEAGVSPTSTDIVSGSPLLLQPQPAPDQQAGAAESTKSSIAKSRLSSALDALTESVIAHAATGSCWVVVSSLSRQPLGRYTTASSRPIDYIPPCVLDVRDAGVFDALFGDIPLASMPTVKEVIYDTGGYPKFLNACMVCLKENPGGAERVVAEKMVAACKAVHAGISLTDKLVLLALAGQRFRYDEDYDFGYAGKTTLASLTGIGLLFNSLQSEGTFVPFIPPFLLHAHCRDGIRNKSLGQLVQSAFSLRTNFHSTLFEEFHMLMDAIKRLALSELHLQGNDRVSRLPSLADFYGGIAMGGCSRTFTIDLTLPVTIHKMLGEHLSKLRGLDGIDTPGVHYFLCAERQPGFDVVIVQRHHDLRLEFLLLEVKHSASDATTIVDTTEIKYKLDLATRELDAWTQNADKKSQPNEWMLMMIPWRQVRDVALKNLPARVAVLPKEKLEDFYTPSMLFKGMFYRSVAGAIDVEVRVHGDGATPRGKTSQVLSRQELVEKMMKVSI